MSRDARITLISLLSVIMVIAAGSECGAVFLADMEADTFWCFTNLMSEIRDNFSKHLDHDHVFGTGQASSSSCLSLVNTSARLLMLDVSVVPCQEFI